MPLRRVGGQPLHPIYALAADHAGALFGRYIALARKGLAESANKDCRRALMNDRASPPRCASTACSGKEA